MQSSEHPPLPSAVPHDSTCDIPIAFRPGTISYEQAAQNDALWQGREMTRRKLFAWALGGVAAVAGAALVAEHFRAFSFLYEAAQALSIEGEFLDRIRNVPSDPQLRQDIPGIGDGHTPRSIIPIHHHVEANGGQRVRFRQASVGDSLWLIFGTNNNAQTPYEQDHGIALVAARALDEEALALLQISDLTCAAFNIPGATSMVKTQEESRTYGALAQLEDERLMKLMAPGPGIRQMIWSAGLNDYREAAATSSDAIANVNLAKDALSKGTLRTGALQKALDGLDESVRRIAKRAGDDLFVAGQKLDGLGMVQPDQQPDNTIYLSVAYPWDIGRQARVPFGVLAGPNDVPGLAPYIGRDTTDPRFGPNRFYFNLDSLQNGRELAHYMWALYIGALTDGGRRIAQKCGHVTLAPLDLIDANKDLNFFRVGNDRWGGGHAGRHGGEIIAREDLRIIQNQTPRSLTTAEKLAKFRTADVAL